MKTTILKTKSISLFGYCNLWLSLLLGSALGVHAQTQILCGQTITNSITTSTQTGQYTYSGSAGQTVTFSFVGDGNCFSTGNNAVMDLYSPTDQKLVTLTHCGVRSTNLTLAASGTYTILVHDSAYASPTVSYSLSVQSFTGGGCGGTPIVCGRTISTNISLTTKSDAYSYVGSAGQTVTFSFVGDGNCFSTGNNAVMDLYNRTGQKLVTLTHCGVRSTNLTLAASGTYTILVHDSAYASPTVSYSLSVQSFTGGECGGTPIVCGQTISTNISLTTKSDAYSYVGSVGQTVTFSFVGNGNCFSTGNNAVMDLYNPTGQKIATLTHCGVRSTNLTLAASGTYTILVHDNAYVSPTVSYSLSVQSFTGGCGGTPIVCGQTISTNISLTTKSDAYSYVGSVGQTVTFSFVGNGNCFSTGNDAVMDLYNPTGQKIVTLTHCGVRSTNLTLAASGTYTILVHDSVYASPTASYSLSVQSFTGGGCGSTAVSCGQNINGSISRPAEVDAFGLGVSPGTLILNFVGNGNCFSTGNNAVLDLYNPTGQKIATLTHCGVRSTNLTLAASGTYTILVHDSAYAQTGTYSFTAICIVPCNYVINTNAASVASGATNGTVNVTAGAGCAWTAVSNATWLRITSGASGSGNGTVNYSVDANPNTSPRLGTMTIAGFTFYVNQAGVQALTGIDVGDVGAPGSTSFSSNSYTMIGSGEDIEDTADAFHFAHLPLTGDCQIIARVLSLQGPQPDAEVGVMMRESLDAGSKHVFLRLTAGTNVMFRRRLSTGLASVETPSTGTNNAWLRLMRMGNTFVGFCSSNGVDWKYVWFTTISISSQMEVGLAVTAHHRLEYATGRVDNVSFGGLTSLSGTWPEAGSRIYLGGEPLGPSGLQPLGGFEMLVRGATGDQFRIRSSSDVAAPFATWSVLGTVTNQWGAVPFLDSQALTNPRRFYRGERVGP